MSFFKKLVGTKQRVPFHFFIFISSMSNLPHELEGESLLALIKRKDKNLQTRYALVSGRQVTWEETMEFSTTLWGKNLGKSDVSFDEKCFTVRIRSLSSDKDLMEFDLDVSQFVKENTYMEHQQTIVLPQLNGDDEDSGIQYANGSAGTQPPRLHVVIRSYADGLNTARGNDFSQFHKTDTKTNPLLNSTVAVVINEPIEDDDDDEPHQKVMNKERRGTRKISVMFNEVTHNGHRQSCLPPSEPNTPTQSSQLQQQTKPQRQSTYRFSIQAGQGLRAPKDSDDSDDDDDDELRPKRNNFDDEDFNVGNNNQNRNKNRLMSTVQGPGHFDIGEDSDYE